MISVVILIDTMMMMMMMAMMMMTTMTRELMSCRPAERITAHFPPYGTNSCQLHCIARNYKTTPCITLHCCRLHFNTFHYISIPCIAATTFQYFTSHLNTFHWKILHAAQPPVNYIPLHYCGHSALQCIYSALRSAHYIAQFELVWSTIHCIAVGRIHFVTLNCAIGIVCTA